MVQPAQACHLDMAAGPAPASRPQPLGDMRFCALLGAADWAHLPQAVRTRFSKRLASGATAIYPGRVTHARMNRAGRFLAQALRLIGAPLPICTDVDVPSIVTVTEDCASGGQNWTRLYARHTGFPQVIHSAKRFSGPTGLEEYIGFGISMSLAISVEDHALVFRSVFYCLAIGTRKIRLPRLLSPGRLTVLHRECGGGAFQFSMRLVHPLFGELVYQAAQYHDGHV